MKTKKATEVAPTHNKDKHFSTQLQTVAELLKNTPYPLTMLEISVLTNIERASVCRYVSKLFRNRESIYLAKKGLCPITKHRAGFYTIKIDENGCGRKIF